MIVGNLWRRIPPHTYEDILTLKGIGNYTASAISSIAFGIPKGVIDGNTPSGFLTNIQPSGQYCTGQTRALLSSSSTISSPDHPSEFNQGMMDLERPCAPTQPQCDQCPLQKHCEAYFKRDTRSSASQP